MAAQIVAANIPFPVYLTTPPGDSSRLFVLEQNGRIRIIQQGALLLYPFLDLSARVKSGGEQGLLGMAFHPGYQANGVFYVHYTDLSGNTQISQFRVSAGDANRADAASEKSILRQEQPFANHNGGDIKFGQDGFLYVALGDGGNGGDPSGNGQNLGTLLGKLLRINVDRGSPYEIPLLNPYVSVFGARPEIWMYGLRNPWRFAFDRGTGDLYIADVGQNLYEEVDVNPGNKKAGENYGWNIMEGNHCFNSSTCSSSGLAPPVLEYGHGDGCSITGGYVYRGNRIAGLQGHYFYSDFCTAFVRSFRLVNGQAAEQTDWTAALNKNLTNPIQAVSSFGEDSDGEVYILQYAEAGTIYKIVPATE